MRFGPALILRKLAIIYQIMSSVKSQVNKDGMWYIRVDNMICYNPQLDSMVGYQHSGIKVH